MNPQIHSEEHLITVTNAETATTAKWNHNNYKEAKWPG